MFNELLSRKFYRTLPPFTSVIHRNVRPPGIHRNVRPSGMHRNVRPSGVQCNVRPLCIHSDVRPSGIHCNVRPSGIRHNVRPSGDLPTVNLSRRPRQHDFVKRRRRVCCTVSRVLGAQVSLQERAGVVTQCSVPHVAFGVGHRQSYDTVTGRLVSQWSFVSPRT